MLFCSQTYLVFFSAVFAAYWLLPWPKARVWLLLAASYYFYASWNRWLALIVVATSTMDYVLALGMDRLRREALRKTLLVLSLIMNLGLLVYFKYANFFLDSLREAVRAAGGSVSLPVLEVILPIGISFYTFEAINYAVDVYRRKMPAETSLAHFMLFILFFPHLVAGPIVRAKDFLPQIRQTKRWDWMRIELGVQLFLLGLFKKVVIADRMAMYADPVYADPWPYSSYATWVATLAYYLQVYGDFSGYSDMALGSAHLLGYKLAKNFDLPFLATSIGDYWRRWHLSLSTWLRDYLYIPLGGSRGGRWRTHRNLILTMVICGLWHGAAWTYVVFGLLHGLILSIQSEIERRFGKIPTLSAERTPGIGTILMVPITFVFMATTLVIFRSKDLETARVMYGNLWNAWGEFGCPVHDSGFWYTLALAFVAHVIGLRPKWLAGLARAPAPVAGLSYATLLLAALLLAPPAGQAFIYFQF